MPMKLRAGGVANWTQLPRWESGGWKLTAPIEALWRGETDFNTLTMGLDDADTNIVRMMLDADLSQPKFKALKPQDVTSTDNPNSDKVGRLNTNDIVTAIDGRRTEMTATNRAGSSRQIKRIRIGEMRWATEADGDDQLLEQMEEDGDGAEDPAMGLRRWVAARLAQQGDDEDSKDPEVLQRIGERLMKEGVSLRVCGVSGSGAGAYVCQQVVPRQVTTTPPSSSSVCASRPSPRRQCTCCAASANSKGARRT